MLLRAQLRVRKQWPLLGLVFFIFFRAQHTLAYPNSIIYGYHSCLSCHYNPHGNGPLTDYGRAVAATALADRTLWNPQTTEEEIAAHAGFFYKNPGSSWFRPALNYRGLYLNRNADKGDAKGEYIPMDLSGSVVAKFLERDRLIFVGQLALNSQRQAPHTRGDLAYRSREHYVGYRLSKGLGVYLGFMDKVFGLRVPDHTAFSRMMTGLTPNEQTHGGVLHYLGKEGELGVQVFLGNLDQPRRARQRGFSSQCEYTLASTSRVGASFLTSQSPLVKNTFYALHTRAGVLDVTSLLVELGQTQKTASLAQTQTLARYIFLQNHYALRRGFFGFITAEYLNPDIAQALVNLRLGPGLQYFPRQRLELRADAYRKMSLKKGLLDYAAWDLTAQIHLWL